MTTMWKAALTAACLVCGSAASATTYYSFDFSTLGFGSISTLDYMGQGPPSIGLNNLLISFKLPTSQVFFSTGNGAYATFIAGGSVDLSSTGVSFSDNFPVGRASDDHIGARACFDNSNVGPTPILGIFSASTACGGASIAFNNNASPTTYTIYNGVVSSLRVSIVEGDSLQQSSFVQGVPEPSTWALMLAGFGLTGYALRKRRASVVLAPTA